MNRLKISLKILMYKLVLTLSLPMSDWAKSMTGEFFSGAELDTLTEVAAFPSVAEPNKRSKSDRPSMPLGSDSDLRSESRRAFDESM